ncbi:MAG TPA: hypothetical protein VI318_09735 [Baekduia sp.]
MLRRLPVVLMVLGLLCALCSGAAVAKGKPAKRCAKGQVRLTAQAPCVKVKPKPGTTVKVTTAGAEKRFAKLAGQRGAKAAARIVQALIRAPGRARVAEVQDDIQDGQWHPRAVDGHPGRYRSTLVQTEGDEIDNFVDGTIEVTVPADHGVEVTTSMRTKMGHRFTTCPDANGIVKAHTEFTQAVRKTAEQDGHSAFVETRTSLTADITVQVGDDANIAKVTYDGGDDIEVRATGAATNRYIIRWTDERQGETSQSVYQRVKADPAGVLAGTYRGPHGSRLSAAEEQMLIEGRLGGQEGLEGLTMRDALAEMRNLWQEDGRCVKLTLDPHAMALAGGQTGTFTATAKLVKDGAPIGGPVNVIASGGTADPEHTTMAPGQALPVKFTMGQGDKGTLIVELRTNRGVGSDIVEIQRPHGWDITYEADATYAQTRTEHGDTDTTTLNLHWKADWHGIFFDGGSYSPMGGVYVSGTMTTKGTLGTGSFSCTGTPGRSYATLLPEGAADGATTLAFVPFTAVVADPETVECDREGYGGDYGTVAALQSYLPYAAHVTITKDMLTQPAFSVPVTLGTGFPANCGEGPTVTCSASGTLTGTVRFTRQ